MQKIYWEDINYARFPTIDGRDLLFEHFKESVKVGDIVEYDYISSVVGNKISKRVLKGKVTKLLPFLVKTDIKLPNCPCGTVTVSYAELFNRVCEKVEKEHEELLKRIEIEEKRRNSNL